MNKLHLILLGAAVVVALLFLSFSAERMRSWQGGYLRVSNPALQAGSAISGRVARLQEGLKTLDELEEENAALTAQNNELRAAGQLLGDLESENRRLREALDYRERSSFKLLPAEVLSRDASGWWNTVKINRGFAQGVDASQPVLTADGLVGRTTTVSKDVSIVLLLTDENCQVAARVEGTSEQGILRGQRVSGGGTPELVLNFLNRDANLQPGMKVFTAGVSGAVFPAGIPLGVIKEFRARELDGQALVEPAADFSGLEDVFVVLGEQMIRAAFLFAAVYIALLVQEFLPPLPFLGGAHLLLVPLLFCYGALWLPFPAMLGFALFTGLLSDLAFLHVLGDRVEIGLGWSMLFYVLAGSALQPLRPLLLEGRWEVHCLASGGVTLALLLAQYTMVCLRRGSFLFDWVVFWQIAGPAVAALLLAPAAYFFFSLLPAGRGEGASLTR